MTDLVAYQLNRFSDERLLHVITLLDQDKEMLTRPKSTKQEGPLPIQAENRPFKPPQKDWHSFLVVERRVSLNGLQDEST